MFKKRRFVFPFFVISSLNAKIVVCRSNGVTCGEYKDKEENTQKLFFQCSKNVKNENFEIYDKAIKNIFPKNYFVHESKIVTCSMLTNTKTHRHRNRQKKQSQRQPFQGFRSSSLQLTIKERSNTSECNSQNLVRNYHKEPTFLFLQNQRYYDHGLPTHLTAVWCCCTLGW